MLCYMLYDRKSETCAALCTAATLVDTIEPLKYPWDTFFGYADTGVFYRKRFTFYLYIYVAVFTVVFYGIVHKVVDQLAKL